MRSAVATLALVSVLTTACAGTEPVVAGPGNAVPGSAVPATGGAAGRTTAPPATDGRGVTGSTRSPTVGSSRTTLAGAPPTIADTAPPPLPAAARPYAVAAIQTVFTDTGRPAGANPVRILKTTVWYPEAPGPFPLVVFAHGWNVAASDYTSLLQSVAAAGYVVAATDFPLTSRAVGAVDEMDVFNQPADLTYVITQMQGTMNEHGALEGRIWPGPVGAIGHSDGAQTVLGLGLNACCLDGRVGAVVALAGRIAGWPSGWFPPDAALPLLNVHGTKDATNAYANGQALFGMARPGSAMLTVEGGDHFAMFTTKESVPTIAKVVIDFLDQTLRADPAAPARLGTDGATKGFSITRK